VWLQAVPETFIEKHANNPGLAQRNVAMQIGINGDYDRLRLNTKIYTADGTEVGNADMMAGQAMGFTVPLSEVIPWEPREDGKPHRYVVEHNLYRRFEKDVDRMESKFGMREFKTERDKFLLNGTPYFLRWDLYQGYHPGSLYLPPDLETTEHHVQTLLEIGMNGIRYHQNVPHPLEVDVFDREGLTYSLEIANWTGEWIDEPKAQAAFADERYIAILAQEAREAMELHYNSPAWLTTQFLNEIPKSQHPDLVSTMYYVAKDFVGESRMVGDVSGFVRPKDAPTDFLTYHFYTQDPEELREKVVGVLRDDIPVVIDEYAGVRTEPEDGDMERWLEQAPDESFSVDSKESKRPEPIVSTESDGSWGYGKSPQTKREALKRLADLTRVIMERRIAGFTKTQFNDTELELNGVTTPVGVLKFLKKKLRAIFSQPAAIEEEAETLAAD
jgi:hypothetical protein